MGFLLRLGMRRRLLASGVSLALLLVLLTPAVPAAFALQDCSPPPVDEDATLGKAEQLLTKWYQDRGLTRPNFQVAPGIPTTVPGDQVFVVEKKMLVCGGVDATDHPVIKLTVGTRVPDLNGLNRRGAEAAVTNAGFTARPDPSDAGNDWLVREQEPQAGVLLKFAEPVTFTLKQAQTPPREVTVPDLLNLTEDKARSAVTNAELVLEVLGATGESPRRVLDQDPPAGATAHLGDPVRVHLRGSVTTGTGNGPTSPSGGGLSEPPSSTLLVPSTTSSNRLLLFLFLLLFLLLAVVLAAVRGRRRAAARGASPGQLHAVAHHDPSPQTVTRSLGSKPGLAIRLEPHGDAGRQTSRRALR